MGAAVRSQSCPQVPRLGRHLHTDAAGLTLPKRPRVLIPRVHLEVALESQSTRLHLQHRETQAGRWLRRGVQAEASSGCSVPPRGRFPIAPPGSPQTMRSHSQASSNLELPEADPPPHPGTQTLRRGAERARGIPFALGREVLSAASGRPPQDSQRARLPASRTQSGAEAPSIAHPRASVPRGRGGHPGLPGRRGQRRSRGAWPPGRSKGAGAAPAGFPHTALARLRARWGRRRQPHPRAGCPRRDPRPLPGTWAKCACLQTKAAFPGSPSGESSP